MSGHGEDTEFNIGEKIAGYRADESGMTLGQSYLVEGSAAYQKATKPLYRYAKGYSIKKGKSVINFCLFVRTFSDNDKAVEKELDACAKSLNSEEILEALTVASMSNFTYTDTFLKGAK